ncbi:hypothetical protein [Mesorhizobium sp. Root157]|uniref:hypothetical protein n=1 Tax=Mesorhizobium sp. Root157 TaxID=1736477 RepID=UPI0009E7BBA3|nr:hypothetical protein [Mesorhizobium sp. Root157]
MDRAKFFAGLRSRDSGVFGTSLSQKQVTGTEAILDEAQRRGTRLPCLAYILATAYHETAHTMQPIEEYGRGKGRKYGVPAGPYGKVYYGRGFVQLTWLANYQKAGEKLSVNLVKFPERALELGIATEILFSGMSEGWFTGKKLDDYLSALRTDYAGARRIINGTDRANMIGGYALTFEKALTAAGYSSLKPRPLPQAKPVPAPHPVQTKPAPAPTPVARKNTLLALLIDAIVAIVRFFKKGN